MKTIFYSLFMVFALSGVNTMSLIAQNSYQTDLLADMATSLKLADQLSTLKDGRYNTELFYKKRPLSVTVDGGRVSHIGYLLFSEEQRQLLQVHGFCKSSLPGADTGVQYPDLPMRCNKLHFL